MYSFPPERPFTSPKHALRKSLVALFLFLTLTSCGDSGNGRDNDAYFPTLGWRERSPEEMGLNSEKLDLVYDYCAEAHRKTDAYLIIKNGYIVAETYFGDTEEKTPLLGYSLTKSFVSALMGIAIDQGYVHSVDDTIDRYYETLNEPGADPAKREITIRDLLTMTSGIQWNEDENPFGSDNDIYNLMFSDEDYVPYVLNKPVIHPPGTVWNYSSGMPILVSGIIENTTKISTFDFARKNLFPFLGIDQVDWESNPAGRTNGGWGISMSMRDYAKLGYLYLNRGNWDGFQVVPEDWVASSLAPASEIARQYGFLWWRAERYPDQIPPDTFMAVGLFSRYIIVIPSHDLVLVRIGSGMETGDSGWDTARFIELVMDAITP